MGVVEQLISRIQVQGASQYEATMKRVASVSTHTASATGKAFSAIGRASALVGGIGLAGLAIESVRVAGKFEALKMALTASTGSAEEATRIFERLKKVQELPGLDFEELIKGTVALQSLELSAEGAERLMRALANATVLSGGSMEEFSRGVKAFKDIIGKKAITAEDIRGQLFEAIPVSSSILQSQFGTSNAEQIAAMGTTWQTFVQKYIEGAEKLAMVNGGMQNDLTNIGSTFQQTLAMIGAVIGPIVIPALQALADVMQKTFDKGQLGSWKDAFLNMIGVVSSALGVFVSTINMTFGVIAQIIGGVIKGIGFFGQKIPVIGEKFKGIFDFGDNMQKVGQVMVGKAGERGASVTEFFDGIVNTIKNGTSGGAKSAIPEVNKAASIFKPGIDEQQSHVGGQQAAYLKYLSQIAENTKPIVDWTRQAFGGGDLGRLGVTPVEMRGFRSGMAGANGVVINVYGSTQETVTDAILSLKRRGVI